jgi:hypothetical protein
MRYLCRTCGCTESQAIADARALGLQRGFRTDSTPAARSQRGPMNSGWRGLEAAEEDGKWPMPLHSRWNVTIRKFVAPIAIRRTCNRGL